MRGKDSGAVCMMVGRPNNAAKSARIPQILLQRLEDIEISEEKRGGHVVDDDPVKPRAHLLLPLDGGENVSEPLRRFVDEKPQLQRFVVGTGDG